jgi:hypothetical protein
MAKAIDRQTGDLLKAEKLASRLCSQDSERIGTCDSILSVILLIQGRVDHETKELIERTIAINTKHCGTDGANTASAYVKLATFYHKLSMTQHTNWKKKDYLCLSKRVYTKTLGPSNQKTIDGSVCITNNLREYLSCVSIFQ